MFRRRLIPISTRAITRYRHLYGRGIRSHRGFWIAGQKQKMWELLISCLHHSIEISPNMRDLDILLPGVDIDGSHELGVAVIVQ